MRLSLLGCKTARAGGRVKGGRSPFILTLDAVFCPCNLRGQAAPHGSVRKDAQPPPNGGVSWGLGSLPQQASAAVCTAVPCLPVLFAPFSDCEFVVCLLSVYRSSISLL